MKFRATIVNDNPSHPIVVVRQDNYDYDVATIVFDGGTVAQMWAEQLIELINQSWDEAGEGAGAGAAAVPAAIDVLVPAIAVGLAVSGTGVSPSTPSRSPDAPAPRRIPPPPNARLILGRNRQRTMNQSSTSVG